MSFGNSPKDNQNTPTSSVYVPGTANSDFTALRGMNSTTDSNSQKSAAASMGIEDGANITQGALADVAVTGDNPGSLSAKLRGLSKMWFDMWDSTNHWLQVKVMNGNPNGQAVMNASSPVALASDQTSIPIRTDFIEVAGQGTGVVNAANTDLFPWIDVSKYKAFSVQLFGTWSGVLTFQGSNDGVNPVSINVLNITNDTGSSSSALVTTNGIYAHTIKTRWIRVRMTSFTSNTSLVGTMELYTIPPAFLLLTMFAAQSGVWTVQPGNTQNTNPWLVAGPNNNFAQPANTAGNVVGKASSGWLFHAIVTTLGTAGLTIYDNASTNSGTPLLVIPANTAVGTIYSFPSGARAVNGITSAGVANCPGVTFHYT